MCLCPSITHVPAGVSVYVSACVSVYVPACVPVYVPACVSVYVLPVLLSLCDALSFLKFSPQPYGVSLSVHRPLVWFVELWVDGDPQPFGVLPVMNVCGGAAGGMYVLTPNSECVVCCVLA